MQPDKIATLYPMVREESDIALPRQWNSKDKYQHLQLSSGNLRVSYKGPGKCQKDAAAVRASHPIPPACGFYYFEIKVVNKGKDGYIGIGLCQLSVNLNRLPGWDKHSWGYHGDDGHSFNSSGTGKPYGPVFASGDVIGCGLDFVNNACFYTKNGTNLGNVFHNLPKLPLYPTVGLQSPNEVIEANFGQQDFVFDFYGYRRELQSAVERQILDHPLPSSLGSLGKWDEAAQRLTFDYLIHYGYHSTALEFARLTGNDNNIDEQIASMKNRQQIQQLVMKGRIEKAIMLTNSLHPNLFAKHRDLLFRLKIRQFIDSVATVNFDVALTPPSSVTTAAQHDQVADMHVEAADENVASNSGDNDNFTAPSSNVMPSTSSQTQRERSPPIPSGERKLTSVDQSMHKNVDIGGGSNRSNKFSRKQNSGNEDVTMMDVDDDDNNNIEPTRCQDDAKNENNSGQRSPDLLAIEKILALGCELHAIRVQLGNNVQESSVRMMREAFSLLAYKDLSAAPMSYLLVNTISDREAVGAALNSAILSSEARSVQPPLNLLIQYADKYQRMGSRNYYVGSCAFATPKCVVDYVTHTYPAVGATASGAPVEQQANAGSSMDAASDHEY